MASGLTAAPAADPLDGIEDLLAAKRLEEARSRLVEAQRGFRARGDSHREAVALLLLATTDVIAGNLNAAAGDLDRSAAMLDAAGAPFDSWIALWRLGVVRRAQGRHDDAANEQRRAFVQLAKARDSAAPFSSDGLRYLGNDLEMPPELLAAFASRPAAVKLELIGAAELRSRTALLVALLDSRRFDDAERQVPRIDELSRTLGGQLAVEATAALARLRWLQGKLDEARDILRRTLEDDTPNRQWERVILDQLIGIEIASKRTKEALAWSDRALARSRRRADLAGEARDLVVRSLVLQDGDASAAEALLVEARTRARRIGDQELLGAIEERLGNLALRARQPERAAAHFEAAIPFLQAANIPFDEARNWLQLSAIYARIDPPTASAALEKARQLNARTGSALLGSWIESLAASQRFADGSGDAPAMTQKFLTVLEQPEMYREGERERYLDLFAYLAAVAARTEKTPEPASPASAPETDPAANAGLRRLLRGILAEQRGDVEAARGEWLAELTEERSRQAEVALLALLGLSYQKEGREEEAIAYLVRAAAALEHNLENVRLEEFVTGNLGSAAPLVYFTLIDLLSRHDRAADAFDYAERARARAFLQGLGNPRLEPGEGADPQLVGEADRLRRELLDIERRALAAPPDGSSVPTDELQRARERYRSLSLRLRVTRAAHQRRALVEPQRLPDIRAGLDRDTTLISYFVSASRIYAWVLDQEIFREVTLSLRPEQLAKATCWAEQLGHGGGRGAQRRSGACAGELPSAETLYQALIAPLRADLRHRRLIVVPHGALHTLPFAALRDPRTRRFLVEDYTLSYAPSASVLSFLRRKETPVRGSSLVLGAPAGLDPNLPPLPGAREEAAAVGRLLSTRPFLGAQATESRLYHLLGEVDLLHIAAHGFYEPRSPQFSRVVLAPDGERDGNLEVHEIVDDLDLSGVNLVVLSACETARGELNRGDEITGLTRAFLVAGSPGVISTLWRIDDDAAATLMSELYRRLLAGATAAEALRNSQLTLLRSPAYRDPGFWAAFTLTGDPQGKWSD